VPGAGFEPACPFGQWILNPSRKPVPPSGPRVKLSGTWFARTAEPLSLGANEAIQETDALSFCNGQIPSVVLSPLNSEAIACSAEQTANVLRCVGEVVTRIGRAIHPIEDPAPVGMNQTSKKGRRVPINERLLPLGQADRALVFATWTMLGEKARPMLRVRRHPCAPDTRDAANTVWQDLVDGQLTFVHQYRIGVTADDPQSVDVSRMSCDASVPEVQAEQVSVRPTRK
jgi:hypothetical protein